MPHVAPLGVVSLSFATVTAPSALAAGSNGLASTANVIAGLDPSQVGPGADVIAALTPRRPQRTPIGTETGTWIDDELRLLEPADAAPAAHAGGKDLIGDRPANPGRR